MKPAMFVLPILLLLLLLAETSQGIRFEEESLAFFRKITHKGSSKDERSVAAAEVVCKEDEPNCSGNVRKLMAKAMPTAKSERSGEKGAGHHFTEEIDKSTSPAGFHALPPETYPDILDIAGMDYSPAKRKPPIHN